MCMTVFDDVMHSIILHAQLCSHAQNAACMQVILWIGAVGVLALAFMKVGNWISRRVDTEHVTAAWLIAPVGGPFVMALVAPAISRAYVEAALFGYEP